MNEAAKIIDRLEPSKRDYLRACFAGAPSWLMEKLQPVRIPAGTTFISENEPAEQVMILLEGRVCAVDYRVEKVVYGFFHFYPIEMFGVMELIGGMDRYKTTLAALDDCFFLRISREEYGRWLRSDMRAFQMEAKEIVNYLLEQARKERLYVLLPGNERLCMVLVDFYESYADGDSYSFYVSRKDFAEMTGLSERTVTRAFKTLEAEGYITKKGWDITLTREQYQRLKQLLETRTQNI